jgi:hypothetical protein
LALPSDHQYAAEEEFDNKERAGREFASVDGGDDDADDDDDDDKSLKRFRIRRAARSMACCSMTCEAGRSWQSLSAAAPSSAFATACRGNHEVDGDGDGDRKPDSPSESGDGTEEGNGVGKALDRSAVRRGPVRQLVSAKGAERG